MRTYIYIRSTIFFLVSQKWHVESHLVRLNTHTCTGHRRIYTDINITISPQRGLTIIIILFYHGFFPSFFVSRGQRLITQCVSGANRETACTLRGRILLLHSRILPRIHNVNYRNYACAGPLECVCWGKSDIARPWLTISRQSLQRPGIGMLL